MILVVPILKHFRVRCLVVNGLFFRGSNSAISFLTSLPNEDLLINNKNAPAGANSLPKPVYL